MRDLAGKTAVVTGAAGGIGRAIALGCAREHMRVVVADINPDGAHETATMVRELGADAMTVRVDVSAAANVEHLADTAFAEFGAVELLVNNAGVMIAGPVWDTPLEDWAWALGVNLMGAIHGIRSFVPRMIAQAGEGHVLNVASLAGLVSAPGMGGYSVGKHGVVALSECLFHDLRLARARIGVSLLCPGFVHTGLADASRTRPHPAPPPTPAQIAITRRVTRMLSSATISAEAVAGSAIDAVKEGRFYVLPHPGSEDAAEQRARAIHDGGPPPIGRL